MEVMTADAPGVSGRCAHYGGLFVGEVAAEVLGDYGCGPNHVLPTGGTARFSGGLSVFNFLRIRTYMRIDNAEASQQVCLCVRFCCCCCGECDVCTNGL